MSLDELFATPPSDVEDLRSRNKLIWYGTVLVLHSMLTHSSEVEGIQKELQSLCGEPGSRPIVDVVQDDLAVLGLLEDLREAILNYQVCS